MDYQNTLTYLYESVPMFQQIGEKAYKIACNADWKSFVSNYKKAFSFAINKSKR